MERNTTAAVERAIGAVLALTLLVYMLLGNFTRYVADDYGIAIAVRLRGFWAQQVADYRFTDGHFAATALETAGALLNPVFVRVLPGALILAWTGLLTLALRRIIPTAGDRGSFLVAAGVVYTTLRVTPSPFLSVYWMTASLEFVVPLLLASLMLLLVASRNRDRNRRLRIALVFVIAFIAAGEAEIYTAAQCVALTVAVAVASSRISLAWRQRLPQIGSAWLGSLAGLAVELAAPGKAVRSAAIAKVGIVTRPSWVTLPYFAFQQMVHFVQTLLLQHGFELMALVLLTAYLGARSSAHTTLFMRPALVGTALAVAGSIAVLLAALSPAALYYGALPPIWDQIIVVYICVCATATLGWAAGRVLSKLATVTWHRAGWTDRLRVRCAALATVATGAVVVIGPVGAVITAGNNLPAIQAYAATKDEQAAVAASAAAGGQASVTVPPLIMANNIGVFSHPAYEDLTSNPNSWINRDEAEYYGLTTIRTAP
ncbi:MAG: DUF6056 family protein [Candidatus Dormiibacterota bacterium]